MRLITDVEWLHFFLSICVHVFSFLPLFLLQTPACKERSLGQSPRPGIQCMYRTEKVTNLHLGYVLLKTVEEAKAISTSQICY